jgi:tetratricopeptide (TPR) repeat protein
MYRIFATGMFAALLALSASARASSLDDFYQGIDDNNRDESEAAVAAFTRALAAGDLADDLRPVALIDRGEVYSREKRYADAVADFTAALARSPGRYDATEGRMRAYARNSQGELAAADCDALIKLRPSFANTYGQCGLISSENGDFARAVPYFKSAVSLSSSPSAFFSLWLEIARRRAGTPDEAEFAALAKKLGLDGWPRPIFDLYLGNATPEAVLAAAEKDEQRSSVSSYAYIEDIELHSDQAERRATKPTTLRVRRCQAAFFVGEWQLLNRNIAQADLLFSKTSDYCGDWLPAKKELARLAQK